MARKRQIAVDLDGTIIAYKEWRGVDHFGKPLPRAKEALQYLQKMGWEIIIFSCRLNNEINDVRVSYNHLKKFLDSNEIPYDKIFTGTGKPIAELYVDDRAVEFTGDWETTLREILGRTSITSYQDYKPRS